MVKKLHAIKIYEIAESGNTDFGEHDVKACKSEILEYSLGK